MITKERLLELIEQGATIYSTHWKEEVDLSLPCKIIDRVINSVLTEVLIVDEGKGFTPNYLLSNLTEDIEGAKWKEEFGFIERTEKLEFPTWGKIIEMDDWCCDFNAKNREHYTLDIDWFMKEIRLMSASGLGEGFCVELTKENYTEACRKCKKLFLGGEDA